MKNDVVLYRKIYEHYKNKIECGLLPGGCRLPSRAKMCKEFNTSEKPVRCAIEMLAKEGFVETKPRKCPVVIYHQDIVHQSSERSWQRAGEAIASDALKTGVFLCYPVIGHGISLCREEDWIIPQTILEHMDPEQPEKFWLLSNRFWRFFVARNGNEFILRTVDSMGYSDLGPLTGSYQVRRGYLMKLNEFLRSVRAGEDPASVGFGDMSFLYGFQGEKNRYSPTYKVPSDSVFLLGAQGLQKKLHGCEERYSNVYLDIIGMISMGYYKYGDFLPSHKELQEIYGVSIDTTLKAIKVLKEWGVVETAPNKGIWVKIDREDLKQIRLDPDLISCHVRRFLDSLELLTLILEGTAVHAMERAKKEEIDRLFMDLENAWKDPVLFHFFPSLVLKFVTEHIQFEMLRSIFEVLLKNLRIGRSIPKLMGSEKTQDDYKNYGKCIHAVSQLAAGDIWSFARQEANLFIDIRSQIIWICRKMGYLEAAMQVYDGTKLWK